MLIDVPIMEPRQQVLDTPIMEPRQQIFDTPMLEPQKQAPLKGANAIPLGPRGYQPPVPNMQLLQPKSTNTWAAIAATKAEAAALEAEKKATTTGSSSSNGMQPLPRRLPDGPLQPTKQQQQQQQPPQAYQESKAETKRVVWIRGTTSNTPLSFLTSKITQGPILSVTWVEDASMTCIIFQHAAHAAAFVAADAHLIRYTGDGIYGPTSSFTVELGVLGFAKDENLDLMETNGHTRRLTFARQGLFASVPRDRFEKDIVAAAGADHVELIHLYNSGNATVVFSGVMIAAVVRGKFLEKARLRHCPYEGVQVSFSVDPCQKPLGQLQSAFTDWTKVRAKR